MSSAVVGLCVVWINFDGFCEISDGFVVPAFVIISTPPNVIGLSKPWIYFYGFIKVGDASIVLTLFK
jgi:hypothetical protein